MSRFLAGGAGRCGGGSCDGGLIASGWPGRLRWKGISMATWIRYTDNQKFLHFINLDTATHFIQPPAKDRVHIHLSSGSNLQIHQSSDADAYNKVLAYMSQIEKQIK